MCVCVRVRVFSSFVPVLTAEFSSGRLSEYEGRQTALLASTPLASSAVEATFFFFFCFLLSFFFWGGGSTTMSTTTTTTSNHHNTKQKKPKGPVLLDVARGQMYSIVHKSAESLGWKLVVSDEAEAEREEESNAEPGGAPKSRGALPSAAASFPVSSDWNVAWHDQSISCKFLCGLQPHQHINHFPGIIELNRKVRMARRLRKMKELFPAAFCFAPDSWCLPMEESALRQVVQEEQAARSRLMSSADGNELKEGVPRESVFIVKPDKGSQAKGIFLYSASNELPNSFAASNEEVRVLNRKLS